MEDHGAEVDAGGSLPPFLASFEDLIGHFDEHFGELGSNERGDSFLELAQKLIPLTPEGETFPAPIASEKKSHDGGVDLLTSETDDGRILYAQSKYKIREKGSIDTIVSKFLNYENSLQAPAPEPDLFGEGTEVSPPLPTAYFFIVTSSKLEQILDRYEGSTLASKEYYDQLRSEGRLMIIDGPRILLLLQQLYRKTHLIPASISLNSNAGWIAQDGVWLGTMRGSHLVGLYDQHGDALFFENVRDFLGATSGRVVTTRSTVNQDIIKTIKSEPEKMLSRNNGVTFRANKISKTSDVGIALSQAAIVNGCQTTMSLVHCHPVPESCQLQVKVVETDDAWDIAMAANYQNPVARIDLDLARYLRPQLVRRVATSLGYAVDSSSETSASAVLNTIYRHKIDYDELKLLYLGLFSRKPSNLFDANYTELRADILARLYEEPNHEEKIFSVLLLVLRESRQALEECRETFSGEEYSFLFRRFYRDEKPRYRAFLAVTAVAAMTRHDLSQRSSDVDEEVSRVRSFLGRARENLENDPGAYRKIFGLSFQALADSLLDVQEGKDEGDIAQEMYSKVSGMAFGSLYKRVLMRIDSASKGF